MRNEEAPNCGIRRRDEDVNISPCDSSGVISVGKEKEKEKEEKMSREIEEMVKYICNACEMGCGFEGECANFNDYRTCGISTETAKALYDAGYRKASDVTSKIFAEIEEGISAAVSALQFENNPIHRSVKRETYSSLMRFIKAIEEKYTEGER